MRRLIAVALLLTAAVFPAVVNAGSFQVAPVRLTLSSDQPTAAINVIANDRRAQTMQLTVMAWTQQDGKDIYRPTNDLLVTPPIFELQSGETRLIRIGLRRAAPATTEAAYRLYIREIPPPPTPGSRGVRVALRIGIPVFVSPRVSVRPELHGEVWPLDHGGLQVVLTNKGKAHAHLVRVRLKKAEGGYLSLVNGGAVYLLPGKAQRWSISPGKASGLPQRQLSLLVVTDHGRQQINLAAGGL